MVPPVILEEFQSTSGSRYQYYYAYALKVNTSVWMLQTSTRRIFWLGWNHTGTPNPFTSHKLLHINALILTYVFLFLPTFEFVEVVVTWLNWHIMSNFPIFGGNTINKLGQILFLCSVGRDKKRQFLLRHKLKWQ